MWDADVVVAYGGTVGGGAWGVETHHPQVMQWGLVFITVRVVVTDGLDMPEV